MQKLSLIWGILSIIGMIVGFIPCLGSLNWLNIPFSVLGLILSVVALTQVHEGQSKGNAIVGIVLCSIAVLFGFMRLALGGGIL